MNHIKGFVMIMQTKVASFLIIYFLFTGLIWANENTLELQVNGLNAKFDQGEGTVNFDEIKWQGQSAKIKLAQQEFSIYLNQIKKIFSMTNDYMTGEISTAQYKIPKEINLFNAYDVNFNFLDQNHLNLESRNIEFYLGNGLQILNNLTIKCQKIKNQLTLNILEDCFQKMSFNINSLQIAASSAETYYAIMPKILAGVPDFKNSKSMTNISFQSENNQFNLTFSSKLLIWLHFNIRGKIKLEEFAQKQYQIKILMEQAKVSVFNIRKIILFVLNKIKIANLQVSDDTIFIKI